MSTNVSAPPAQHRQQTQQPHLVERINDFAALPKIRKIFEIIKKNNCFADRSKFRRSLLHRVLRKTESATTDSALHPFVTHLLTRLPWRHGARALRERGRAGRLA
jgi:hypothetical protein